MINRKLLLSGVSLLVFSTPLAAFSGDMNKPFKKPAVPQDEVLNRASLHEEINSQKTKIEQQAKQLEEQQKLIEALQKQVNSIISSQAISDSALGQYRGAAVDTSTSSTPVGDEKNDNKKKAANNNKKDVDKAKEEVKKIQKEQEKKEAEEAQEEQVEKEKAKGDVDKAKVESEDKQVTETVGTERKPQPRQKPPEVPALDSKGANVLLPKGRVVIEPTLEYNRSSALRVAIEGFTIVPALNIGSFEVTQVDRDTMIASVTGRVGVTDRFELETRVPYVYRNDSTLSRPIGAGAGSDSLSEVDGMNIGDIEVAGHYQINKGQNGWPFFIGNLNFKTKTGTSPFEVPTDPTSGLQTELPTGSGFYAVQPSVTAIFPSDPVVFYSNLGYVYNMGRNVGGSTGDIDPGDAITLGMGMGFSVNERSSFSLGYSHSTVFETTQNGNTIPNSDILQVGTLNTGFAYRLNERVNLNFNIGAGLTNDAPDVQLIFRVPVAFDVFRD